jgi:monoamine oxidase
VADGYDAVIRALVADFEIRLNTIATEVRWRRGEVSVSCRSSEAIRAEKLIVTLPLGVMQSDAVRFEPEIEQHRAAARLLAMGPVIKVICRFREAFWEELRKGELRSATFFFGGDRVAFPTWWTMLAMRAPTLVGWAGGPKAAALSNQSQDVVQARAIESLARILDLPRRKIRDELESFHTHDWQADTFARGAYSYVPVGGLDAMKRMAQPIDGTLFFAGEHTHWEGMSGTVAGALASGHRAAAECLHSS